jgi:hypothetical protein
MSLWTPPQRKRVKKAMKLKRKRAHELEYKKLEKQIHAFTRETGIESRRLIQRLLPKNIEGKHILRKFNLQPLDP